MKILSKLNWSLVFAFPIILGVVTIISSEVQVKASTLNLSPYSTGISEATVKNPSYAYSDNELNTEFYKTGSNNPYQVYVYSLNSLDSSDEITSLQTTVKAKKHDSSNYTAKFGIRYSSDNGNSWSDEKDCANLTNNHYVSLNCTLWSGSWKKSDFSSGNIYVKVIAYISGLNNNQWDNKGILLDWVPLSINYAADNTPPNASITYPTNGSYLKGNVNIAANVSDTGSGVANVEFWYASINTKIGEDNTAPYSIDWDTTEVPDGNHELWVKAFDVAGNRTTSQPITVAVDNTKPTATLVFPNIGSSAKSFNIVFSEQVNVSEAEDPANYFLNNWPGASGSGDLADDATVVYDAGTKTSTVSFNHAEWYVSPEQQWGVSGIHDLAGNLMDPNPTSAYSTALEAPVTTPHYTGTKGPNSVYNTNVNITLDATDPNDGSGVKQTYYNLDDTGYIAGDSLTVSIDGKHSLCYYSVDWAGNEENETCADFEIDKTPPTITLKGGEEITLYVGDSYLELGAEATDIRDGDLTASINISDDIDTSLIGAYTVSYNVADLSGNSALTIYRKVYVVPKPLATPVLLSSTTPTVPYIATTPSATTTGGGGVTQVAGVTTTADPTNQTPTTNSDPQNTNSNNQDYTNVLGTTNSRDLFVDYWWAWILAVLGAGGFIWLLVARRRHNNDESQF